MTEILEVSLPVVVRFADESSALNACSTIEAMLGSARAEVETLFAEGDGVADGNAVNRIYAKYGFRNDVGWSQQRPLEVTGKEIKWDVPLGVELEDVQLLLLSLGAKAISLQPEEEEFLGNLHPLSMSFEGDFEVSEDEEQEAEEFTRPPEFKKKLLH